MKCKRLICVWTSMNMKVYLNIIRVLTRSQKADISEVSKVGL